MPLDDLLRAVATGDEHTIRRAVVACGDVLREGRIDDVAGFLSTLLPLAVHPSPTVRQSLADVSDALPEATFDELHPRLLQDRDAYVRAAAEAAGHRHAKLLRQTHKARERDQRERELLAEIERRFKKDGRRLAERAVEHALEHFAARLDHEVSKSQSSIRRALADLERELDRPGRNPHTVKELFATLSDRSRFAYSMVRRARDYVERGNPVFVDESLAALVGEARAQLFDRLGHLAPKLAFTSDVDRALRIEADRYFLLQALQNILQNAAESYDAKAERLAVRVSATTRRGGSEIVLVVADDGAGITEERRKTLFVPFESKKPGGTGLGLSIVRRSVEEVHGGLLAVESAPGSGTRVTMVLPARQVTPHNVDD